MIKEDSKLGTLISYEQKGLSNSILYKSNLMLSLRRRVVYGKKLIKLIINAFANLLPLAYVPFFFFFFFFVPSYVESFME